MGRIPRTYYPGAMFHVIARGNHRERIFFEREDWRKFIELLIKIKGFRPFKLHAYCLMPNHFHLLVEILDTPLHTIMHLLLGRYAKYLNRNLGRTGHVFQDRYKAIPCPRDEYFRELVRYIHLNPVRAGLVSDPGTWPYSGHREYYEETEINLIDSSLLTGMLSAEYSGDGGGYLRFILDGIGKKLEKPPVVPKIKPATIPRQEHASIEEIENKVSSATGILKDILRSSNKTHLAMSAKRKFILEAFRAGHPPVAIARHMGLAPTAISRTLNEECEECGYLAPTIGGIVKVGPRGRFRGGY